KCTLDRLRAGRITCSHLDPSCRVGIEWPRQDDCCCRSDTFGCAFNVDMLACADKIVSQDGTRHHDMRQLLCNSRPPLSGVVASDERSLSAAYIRAGIVVGMGMTSLTLRVGQAQRKQSASPVPRPVLCCSN